jgi:hypothetical protein
LASAGRKESKFHGRVEGDRHCSQAGCTEHGEFRAPPAGRRRQGFDGPGEWRWLCLDHVRAFNSGYNYFNGMSPEEIEAAQTPYGGWERETRAFSANGSPPPRWADFADPLDAIGARFRRAPPSPRTRDGRELSAGPQEPGPARAWNRCRPARASAALCRARPPLSPDRNGGDRSHEKALQAVIRAYTELKSRPAFA